MLEGVISSMTCPRRKWPQRWFILLWEASLSRRNLHPIFPWTKSKVESLCLHVQFYCSLGRIVVLCVTGAILMQVWFYSSGSFIHNINSNCLGVEGNVFCGCAHPMLFHFDTSIDTVYKCSRSNFSCLQCILDFLLLFQSVFDL